MAAGIEGRIDRTRTAWRTAPPSAPECDDRLCAHPPPSEVVFRRRHPPPQFFARRKTTSRTRKTTSASRERDFNRRNKQMDFGLHHKSYLMQHAV